MQGILLANKVYNVYAAFGLTVKMVTASINKVNKRRLSESSKSSSHNSLLRATVPAPYPTHCTLPLFTPTHALECDKINEPFGNVNSAENHKKKKEREANKSGTAY